MSLGLTTKGYVDGGGGSFASAPVVATPSISEIYKIIRCFTGVTLEDAFLNECLFAYDNAPFEKQCDKHFIRVTIKTLESKQVMFGSKRTYRTSGIVHFQVFTPIELGDGETNEIADIIMDQFRGRNVSGIRFRAPNTTTRRRFDSEWMLLVNCPFQADQIA